MFLGMSREEADAEWWRGTDEGGKLKEQGYVHWISPNTGANNTSGFTALPGGYRDNAGNGGFLWKGYNAYFWSSTEYSSTNVWFRELFSGNSDIARRTYDKKVGYSIRCLRDYDYLPYIVLSDDTLDFGINSSNIPDTTRSVYLVNNYPDTISIDSIFGDQSVAVDVQEDTGLTGIPVAPGDTIHIDITLFTSDLEGTVTETIMIRINSYDTLLILKARIITYPDTLEAIPGDGQITLTWDSANWQYIDRVYIYRDLVLVDSVEITSNADTSFTDTGLVNYRDYTYFIRTKDTWSYLSSPTDTITAFPCVIVTDFDGNTYNTVKIGKQVWMKENMKSTHYSDGTSLVYGTGAGNISGDYTTKYWFVYGDNPGNKANYGLLYTWAGAMDGVLSSDGNPSGVQGICPFGWHLPGDEEWKELERFLGMSRAAADGTGWRGSDVGGKLKEAGTSHWISPNTGATDEFGFTALPGGIRYDIGTFSYIGDHGLWWNSTEVNTSNAWCRAMRYDHSGIGRGDNSMGDGFSVRCLRDFDYRPYIAFSDDTLDFGIISRNIPDTTQSMYLVNYYPDTISIDSIFGDPSFVVDVQETAGYDSIQVAPGDTIHVDITLNTAGLAGLINDTIHIRINSYDTLLIVKARIITYPDTMEAIPGDGQITLTWDSTNWQYIDRVFIYRDLLLVDSVEITSNADTFFTDTGLINYREYTYFNRTKDNWGNLSIASDTIITIPNIKITDYDGNIYNTVKIGKQVWMRENLKTTHYTDQAAIPLVEETTEWESLTSADKAYCYANNSMTNREVYGALYTWAAAINGTTGSELNPSGVQCVCPYGWHLPSDEEWKELEMFLGMSQAEADNTSDRGTDEGGKLKETGYLHWSGPNTGANNSSGFTALPGGWRYYDGLFHNLYGSASFWSSSKSVFGGCAWRRILNYDDSKIFRDYYYNMDFGVSVRCLRDFDYRPYIAFSDDTLDFGIISRNFPDTARSLYLVNNYPDTISIDSIFGDPSFAVVVQEAAGLTNITVGPGDTIQLDITLNTEGLSGRITGTAGILINSYDTILILKAEIISYPGTLQTIPGDQTVCIVWDSTNWEYIGRMYIYRDTVLIDSIEITSAGDTSYTDTGLDNYRQYNYYIRSRDIWGNLGIPSDTIPAVPCEIVMDFDGNPYNTVKIGRQVWMKENMKTTHYADGNVIPLVEGQTEWDEQGSGGKAYCYYNNDTLNKDVYGSLYNWAAAMNGVSSSNGNPSGVQGICPGGWHMPSDEEWKELEMFLGMSREEADIMGDIRGTDEGGKLKEEGTVHWSEPNSGATNSSGFTALPGGYRDRSSNGGYLHLGGHAYFWTSTEYSITNGWERKLTHENPKSPRRTYDKIAGYSVRCLRDFNYLPWMTFSTNVVSFGTISRGMADTTRFVYLANTHADTIIIDSIYGADPLISLDVPATGGLTDIQLAPGDSLRLDITLHPADLTGMLTDTIIIHINSYDTTLVINARAITFPDTLIAIQGDEQITLSWDSTGWQYLDKVYIYRDLALINSMEITSASDSSYTDTGLLNNRLYRYFIRFKDEWGYLSSPSDTIKIHPVMVAVDYDGNIYNPVIIGNQVWLRENLKTTHYADGTALVDGTGAGDITGDYETKYWFVYGDNPANKATYGLMYTWTAAMNGAASSDANPSGVQGVCPAGWHLPSDAEWTELIGYLGGESVAGGKLKEAGFAHWDSPNTGATNETGFTALPGGRRFSYGSFSNIDCYGLWWSSTEYSTLDAWGQFIECNYSYVSRFDYNLNSGFSVRCLRDFDYLNYLTISEEIIDFGEVNRETTDISREIYMGSTYYDTLTIGSIDGADRPFSLDIPGYPAPQNIIIPPENSIRIDVKLSTEHIAGIFSDTLLIHIGGQDTSVLLKVEIPFPNTLITTPADRQITLSWDTACWSYRDKVYIYRDNILYDSVMISSPADTNWTDSSVINYRYYTYFTRTRDSNGNLMSSTSDTVIVFPGEVIRDFDGNTYHIIKIGDQLWMKENLQTASYADGTGLVNGTGVGDISGDYTTKYWFVYGDNPAYKPTYGLLYTWAAAMKGASSSAANPSGVQGICPTGWHLPSDAEWKELEMFLGMSQADADGTQLRGIDEGAKLKEAGYIHWNSPNTGADNFSGFTALPGGYRDRDGYFHNTGSYAFFWSSTEGSGNSAWYRDLTSGDSEVYRDYYYRFGGFSVRCLRDFDYLDLLSMATDTVNFDLINKSVSDTTLSIYLKYNGIDTLVIDSITGVDPPFTLSLPGYPELQDIPVPAMDSVNINITLSTPGIAGIFTDTIWIHINEQDTSIILNAEIAFPDTLAAVPADEQVILSWDSACWQSRDMVYIYRDNLLTDSVMIDDPADTIYTDHNLNNYQYYTYFIRSKDIRGNTCHSSDTVSLYPCLIVEDADGNSYRTVKIGNQVWMHENLRTTHYADSTPLITGRGAGDITGNYSTRYYFWYGDDSASHAETYGALYTWAAAMNSSTSSDLNPSGVQGVCPDGWHLPSDKEWKQLEISLGMSQAQADGMGYRGTDQGGKLKTAGTEYWNSPNNGATNASDFSALPGGYRNSDGNFYDLGAFAEFWSSAENNFTTSWNRKLNYNYATVLRGFNLKNYGMSVRCVMDRAMLPSPKNPVLTSCSQINTLSWSPIEDSILLRYRIYRKVNAQPWSLYDSINDVTGQDTTYTDAAAYNNIYAYYLTAVDSFGKESNPSEVVYVTARAPVVLGSDREACSPNTVTLDAGPGFTAYVWSAADSAGQTLQVATSGNYRVEATDSNGCMTSDTVQVDIWPIPIVELGENTDACEGDTVTLDAQTIVPSCQWSVPDSTGRTLRVTQTGQYWVRITDINGCRNTDTINVVFNPNPAVNLGEDFQICPGAAAVLDAGGGYSDYHWSVADSAGQTLTVYSAGIYSVEVTDGNGCKGSDSIEVSYFDLPAVQITGDTSICEGETTTLDAGAGYQVYSWTGALSEDTRAIVTGEPGKYKVTTTDNYGCLSSDSIGVIVHSNPVPELGPDIDVCQGEPVVLEAGAYDAYEWSLADSVSPTLHPNESSVYWVRVTDSNGCQGSDTIPVTFRPLPVPEITGDTVICPGGTLLLNAGAGFDSYNWSVPESTGQTIVISSAGIYSVAVTKDDCEGSDTLGVTEAVVVPVNIKGDTTICDGGYSDFDAGGQQESWLWSTGDTVQEITLTEPGAFWVEGTTAEGCISTDTAILYVYSNPVSRLEDTVRLCAGSEAVLDAGGEAGDTFLWSNDSTTQTIVVTTGGTYTVEITNEQECTVTDAILVILLPAPDVTVAVSDSFITVSGSTTLTATGANSYTWWPSYKLSTTTGNSVIARPDTNTTYYVAGTNEFGCPDTAELRILVYCNKACGSGSPYIAHSGIINTGCTNNVYWNNDTCTWVITPHGADTIYLYISSPDSFDIRTGDILKVYNGVDRTGSLLYTFDNDHKPSSAGLKYIIQKSDTSWFIIGGSEMYLEFISNAGDPGTGFQALYSDKPLVATEDIEEYGLRIYPNPFNNKTTIEFPNPQRERYHLFLLTLTGKIVRHEYNLIEGRYELDREDLPAGVYVLVVEGRQVYRGKIIIE